MRHLGYANEPIRPSDWSRAIFNDMYCSLIGYAPDERPLLLAQIAPSPAKGTGGPLITN